MSEGLARVAGGGVPVTFDGVTFVLQPMTINDYATIEQHILFNRKNPVEEVKKHLDGLDVEVQKYLVQLAYEDLRKNTTVSLEELSYFLMSLEGQALSLWLIFNKSHPGKWTLERVTEIIKAMTHDEVTRLVIARDQAAGVDELGNSTGQTPE